MNNKISKIADIIEAGGEGLLDDEGVDRSVCLELAEAILKALEEPAATVPPSRGESVLVELTYQGEDIFGTSLFYNENTNRLIPIDQPRIVKPSVTISVLGGVAEIEDRHPAVEVTIHDYDNEEE